MKREKGKPRRGDGTQSRDRVPSREGGQAGENHPRQQQEGLALNESGWESWGGDQLASHSQT